MSIAEPPRTGASIRFDDEPEGNADDPSLDEMDAFVLDLQNRLLEIEERLIPTGLHVLDEIPAAGELADSLLTVVAFEHPELDLPALYDLLATNTGTTHNYAELVKLAQTNRAALEAVEAINLQARTLVWEWVEAGANSAATAQAARHLAELRGTLEPQAERLFDFLGGIVARLQASDETEAFIRAVNGEYILPSPGGDIIRNPEIVPTGRNIHALNPAIIPGPLAIRQARITADALLERLRSERQGQYPETIAIVLWGTDNIKTEGEATAQVWHLMGVRPVRDSLNRIHDVTLISLEQLGRPRIDCVVTVSGIYRDLFGQQMKLLDKAARLCAEADEPPGMNYIRKHALEDSVGMKIAPEETAVRIFSNAAGTYGANVNFAIDSSAWVNEEELTNIFVNRKCFAYGTQADGEEARAAYERSLARVEATFQNIDSVEFGITDIDHYNEYLGALTRTVERIGGTRPQTLLADFTAPAGKIRTIQEMVALETRTKLLNPRWYEGMLKHGYEGVHTIQNQVTNTYGWSVTCKAVDGWIYNKIADTYILDEQMRARLQALNPHAAYAIADRLLEATGRGYWKPEPEMLERLRELSRDLEDALEGVG